MGKLIRFLIKLLSQTVSLLRTVISFLFKLQT